MENRCSGLMGVEKKKQGTKSIILSADSTERWQNGSSRIKGQESQIQAIGFDDCVLTVRRELSEEGSGSVSLDGSFARITRRDEGQRQES
jgi:hypothetical protein